VELFGQKLEAAVALLLLSHDFVELSLPVCAAQQTSGLLLYEQEKRRQAAAALGKKQAQMHRRGAGGIQVVWAE
jgi:hypothetical protein